MNKSLYNNNNKSKSKKKVIMHKVTGKIQKILVWRIKYNNNKKTIV